MKKDKIVRILKPDDIMRSAKDGSVFLGAKKITDLEKKSLIAEAKALKSMRLWSILVESPKQLCYERGWRDSTTLKHLDTAKSMYSVLDTQESIVAKILGMV